METISTTPYSPEKSVSAHQKPVRNPKRKSPRGSVPRKSAGNLNPPCLPPPHVLSTFSHPPSSAYNNSSYSQPPLLPLPRVSASLPPPRVHSSLPPLNRGISCPPRTAGKVTTAKSHHRTQKKSTVQPVEPSPRPELTRTGSVPIGSYPGDDWNRFDGYPGPSFIMLVSPPPSSLPMPRFSVKPKMSCNAEAAGTDDGATNDLRRFLRLP